MSENDKKIMEELEKQINVVEAPKTVKKTSKISRIIKLASSTFRKTNVWFKKQQLNRIEKQIANKKFDDIKSEEGKKEARNYLDKKALKYEKLKDKLNLLITGGESRIPDQINIPVEKRAINLRSEMFKALRYNGKNWVIPNRKLKEIFSNDNTQKPKEENINYNNIDEMLKEHTRTSNEKTNNTSSEERFNTTGMTEEEIAESIKKVGEYKAPQGIYNYKKDSIVQDLPINSVEEQNYNTIGMSAEEIIASMKKILEENEKTANTNSEEKFNTTGMTEEEIAASIENIGEYKARETNNNNVTTSIDEYITKETKENGTVVKISKDGKSRLYEFNNVNSEEEVKKENNNENTSTDEYITKEAKENGTVVKTSKDGKSRLYEFNNVNSKEENTQLSTSQNNLETKKDSVEENSTKNGSILNDLNEYRDQLMNLKRQREQAEQARLEAETARTAALTALKEANDKAEAAKNKYQNQIDKETAAIAGLNESINGINSDTQRSNEEAAMVNKYAEEIEKMISGSDDITSTVKTGNSK